MRGRAWRAVAVCTSLAAIAAVIGWSPASAATTPESCPATAASPSSCAQFSFTVAETGEFTLHSDITSSTNSDVSSYDEHLTWSATNTYTYAADPRTGSFHQLDVTSAVSSKGSSVAVNGEVPITCKIHGGMVDWLTDVRSVNASETYPAKVSVYDGVSAPEVDHTCSYSGDDGLRQIACSPDEFCGNCGPSATTTCRGDTKPSGAYRRAFNSPNPYHRFSSLPLRQTRSATLSGGSTSTSGGGGTTTSSYRVSIDANISIEGDVCSTSSGHSAPAAEQSGRAGADSTTSRASPVAMYVNGKKVTGRTATVVAGEPVKLSVNCEGKATSGTTWSIEGASTKPNSTTAVSQYVVFNDGANSGSLTHSLPKTPTGSSLDLYFVRASTGSGLKVTARTPGKGTVTKRIIVRAPDANPKPKIRTCRVFLSDAAVTGSNSQGAWVGPGYNQKCQGDPSQPLGKGNPGIEWSFPVHSGKGVGGGKLAVIQLVSIAVTHDAKACPALAASNEADVTTFYDSNNPEAGKRARAYTSLKPGGTASAHDRDSPHLLLEKRTGLWYEDFRATDYVMFQPAKAQSIWVPLGKLSWSWTAQAKRSNDTTPWAVHVVKEMAASKFSAAYPGLVRFNGGVSPPPADQVGC